MGERNWTPAQRLAIAYGEGSLLVSAAAGSGKTATLTEKIVRMIEEHPERDVTRLLVVTFTRAAAGELRERIAAGLQERLTLHPESRELNRCLTELERAPICTIDSFCLSVLRPRFAALGLPPDFAVAEEAVTSAMRRDAMSDAVNEAFAASTVVADATAVDAAASNIAASPVNPAVASAAADDIASFRELAEALASSRDATALDAVLLPFAERLRSFGYTPAALADYASNLREAAGGDGFSGSFGDGLRREIADLAAHYSRLFDALCGELASADATRRAYLPAAQSLAEWAARLEKASSSLPDVRALLDSFSPPSIGSVKKEAQTDSGELFKEAKGAFLDAVGELRETFFAVSPAQTAEDARRTARLTGALGVLLTDFEARYTAEKQRRGVLDFSDLSRETLRLLVGADGKPTAVAAEIGSAYDAVFVDEYQDTDRAQDAIFAAVAGEKPRCLVGDVKQSIYAFRGAEPAVFSAYRRLWPPVCPEDTAAAADAAAHIADASVNPASAPASNETASASVPCAPASPAPGRSLFMSENFRCDRPVIEFTNLLSDFLFPHSDIPYSGADRLVFAKPDADPAAASRVEVCLLPPPARGEVPAGTSAENPEAAYVAQRIAGLLGRERKRDGTVITPSDVAILLRSPGGAGAAYAAALESRGIRCSLTHDRDFFTRPEILLALCLLHAVDNPTRDVELAGLMKSPIGGFTLDELIAVRRATPAGVLWDAVRTCADSENDSDLRVKCAAFRDRLTAYREKARGLRADRMLCFLYRDTGILSLCAGESGARENLLSLYDLARRYESGVFGGLYGFLRHVTELTERGDASGHGPSNPAADAVRVLSIHGSKGLEYPVVFLCDTARRFNFRDAQEAIQFDPQLGVTMSLPDPGGLVRCHTAQQEAVIRRIRSRSREEEMRLLYVAVTRARERLIVTGTAGEPEEAARRAAASLPYTSRYSVAHAGCMLDWILPAMAGSVGRAEAALVFPAATSQEAKQAEDTREAAASLVSEPVTEPAPEPEQTPAAAALASLFRSRMAFRYPYRYLAHLPGKLIVSRLHPGVIDPENEEPVAASLMPPAPEVAPRKMPLPRFLSGMPPHTAAEAGIATHAFFEFCHPESLAVPGGIDAELTRLVSESFITEEMSRLVRREDIAKFIRSTLFARMRRARRLIREFRFYASVPAAELTRQPERAAELRAGGAEILVQGVVDLLLEDERGRLVLIDYKTDHLTAGELADPSLAAAKLRPRHRDQLFYYRRACEKMLGRPVDELYVYSLPLGDCVDMLSETEIPEEKTCETVGQ